MSHAYSFLNVQASITGPGGSFSLGSGVGAAEEGITIAFVEDKNTMTVGADGEPMHSMHAGKAAKVTVRLLKTSPTNKKLSVLYNLQTSNGGVLHGQNVLTVRDTARGDVAVGRHVAFTKHPDLSFAKVGNTVEWVFDAGKTDILLGDA